jgi:hypothetical protein
MVDDGQYEEKLGLRAKTTHMNDGNVG